VPAISENMDLLDQERIASLLSSLAVLYPDKLHYLTELGPALHEHL